VDEREVTIDASRKQGGILVVRLHDQPAAFEGAKVLGESERHARPPFAERRVRDGIFAQFLHERDPRVLDSPYLLGVIVGIG
jgi:hypothetical protein